MVMGSMIDFLHVSGGSEDQSSNREDRPIKNKFNSHHPYNLKQTII